MVRRPGVEPGESETVNLQSTSLPHTVYRRILNAVIYNQRRIIVLNLFYTWQIGNRA